MGNMIDNRAYERLFNDYAYDLFGGIHLVLYVKISNKNNIIYYIDEQPKHLPENLGHGSP